MKELVFLLEEKSAADLLAGLWPRLIPPESDVAPRFLTFQGKRDLEKEIPGKIRVYRNPEARFLIMRDQDSGDCSIIKARLTALCRANTGGRPFMVRIVCRELENWYLAQLGALENALGLRGLVKRHNKSRYRNPDNIQAAQELAQLTGKTLAKRAWARAIGPYLDVGDERSTSFKHFVCAVRQLCAD
jgi:hypothetical protein